MWKTKKACDTNTFDRHEEKRRTAEYEAGNLQLTGFY